MNDTTNITAVQSVLHVEYEAGTYTGYEVSYQVLLYMIAVLPYNNVPVSICPGRHFFLFLSNLVFTANAIFQCSSGDRNPAILVKSYTESGIIHRWKGAFQADLVIIGSLFIYFSFRETRV